MNALSVRRLTELTVSYDNVLINTDKTEHRTRGTQNTKHTINNTYTILCFVFCRIYIILIKAHKIEVVVLLCVKSYKSLKVRLEVYFGRSRLTHTSRVAHAAQPSSY